MQIKIKACLDSDVSCELRQHMTQKMTVSTHLCLQTVALMSSSRHHASSCWSAKQPSMFTRVAAVCYETLFYSQTCTCVLLKHIGSTGTQYATEQCCTDSNAVQLLRLADYSIPALYCYTCSITIKMGATNIGECNLLAPTQQLTDYLVADI